MGLDIDLVIGRKHYNLTRDYRIFSQFSGAFRDDYPPAIIKTQAVPKGHRHQDMEDGYGPVDCCEAREMKKLLLPEHCSDNNRRIKELIDSLPDDELIVLFWH